MKYTKEFWLIKIYYASTFCIEDRGLGILKLDWTLAWGTEYLFMHPVVEEIPSSSVILDLASSNMEGNISHSQTYPGEIKLDSPDPVQSID